MKRLTFGRNAHLIEMLYDEAQTGASACEQHIEHVYLTRDYQRHIRILYEKMIVYICVYARRDRNPGMGYTIPLP